MSPLELAIDQIREIDADFADFVKAMYTKRHTGYTGLHWLNGIPAACDLPGVKVRFARPSSRKAVDKCNEVPDAVPV